MEKLGDRFDGPDLGGDEVQLVARPFDAEAREGARRRAGRHLLQAAALQLQDRLAGAQRGLLRAALGRAGFHPPAHRAERRRSPTSAAISSAPKPTFPRSTTSRRSRHPVDWKWAFERQWLFYKLWGRLLYDPTTPDAVFAGGVHAPLRREARRRTCSRRTRSRRTRSCGWRRCSTRAGISRCTARACSRCRVKITQIHRRRRADQAADAGSGLRYRRRLRGARAGRRHVSARTASRRRLAGICSNATAARRSRWSRDRTARQSALKYEVADVRRGPTSACTSPRSCAARSRSQTFRPTGDEQHQQQAIGHLRTGARRNGTRSSASRARLQRHEAHALQRQFLRREPRQSFSLGAASATRWRTGRRSCGPRRQVRNSREAPDEIIINIDVPDLRPAIPSTPPRSASRTRARSTTTSPSSPAPRHDLSIAEGRWHRARSTPPIARDTPTLDPGAFRPGGR